MSCETVTGSIVALLDGELAQAERREVEAHLASCTACAHELAALEATRRAVARHFAAVADGVATPHFDEVWRRAAGDPKAAPSIRGAARPGSVARPSRGRRWLWAGASAGLALAAGLALLVFVPRPPGDAPRSRDARTAKAPVVASAPAAKAVVAKAAPGAATRVAKGTSDDAPAKEQVARRVEPKAPDAGTPDADGAAVAVNELDPPRELIDRPDMFLNYPMVRKLEELRHLDSVLADHGADDGTSDGDAG